jgi:hypothetical protein
VINSWYHDSETVNKPYFKKLLSHKKEIEEQLARVCFNVKTFKTVKKSLYSFYATVIKTISWNYL